MYGSFSSHRVATSRFVGQWKIQKIHKIQREKPPNNICNIIMHSNCCLAACITQWQNTRGVNNNNNNNRKSEQQQLKRVASKIANCNKVWNVKTKKKRSVQTAIEKEAAKTQITIRVKNKRGENIKTKKQQQQSIATATNTIERKKNVSAIYFTHFDCPTIFNELCCLPREFFISLSLSPTSLCMSVSVQKFTTVYYRFIVCQFD